MTVEPTVGPLVSKGAASQIVAAASLDSAKLLHRVVLGQVKAPVAVRVNAAIRMMEFDGFGQREGKGQDQEAAAALAVLASLRARAAGAQAVEILPERAEVVVPTPDPLPQQPDTQSAQGAAAAPASDQAPSE